LKIKLQNLLEKIKPYIFSIFEFRKNLIVFSDYFNILKKLKKISIFIFLGKKSEYFLDFFILKINFQIF